jgi:hypothetical protein
VERSKVLAGALLLLLAAAGGGSATAQDSQPESFVYDAWLGWNAFDTGAWVEYEVRTVTGRTPQGTIKQKRRIDSKSAAAVVLSVDTTMDDRLTSTVERISKPSEEPKPIGMAECAKCKKVHPSDTKQRVSKLRVGTADLECILVEGTSFSCDGKKLGTLSRWFHKDVPGWIVKHETVVEDRRTTTTCTAFGK